MSVKVQPACAAPLVKGRITPFRTNALSKGLIAASCMKWLYNDRLDNGDALPSERIEEESQGFKSRTRVGISEAAMGWLARWVTTDAAGLAAHDWHDTSSPAPAPSTSSFSENSRPIEQEYIRTFVRFQGAKNKPPNGYAVKLRGRWVPIVALPAKQHDTLEKVRWEAAQRASDADR